jgi:hypothetical protein
MFGVPFHVLSRLFFLPHRDKVDRAYEVRLAARETIPELAQASWGDRQFSHPTPTTAPSDERKT